MGLCGNRDVWVGARCSEESQFYEFAFLEDPSQLAFFGRGDSETENPGQS